MRRAMAAVAGLTLFFLVLPILALVPMSLSAGNYLTFPPQGLSLRWYQSFLTSRDWMESLGNSVRIAVTVMLLACLVGTPSGIALARGRFPGKEAARGLVLAPIIVPIMILAIAFYYAFAQLRLVGTFAAMVLAHLVLATPYVVLNVEAVMRTFDVRLERAARMLGATAWQTFAKVTFPLIRVGILTGALFAFIVSFDEVVVAIFLGGTSTVTLPKQMFASISQDDLNPTVGAITTMQIAMSLLVFGASELLRGRGRALFASRRAEGESAPAAATSGSEDAGGRSASGLGGGNSGAGLDLRGKNVRLEGLHKRFGTVVAVDDVSFEIGAGEFVTLLGPSGSGKTTILNMVAGFETPTAGEIYVGGEPITKKTPNHRNIGMVFQDYALFPHMTVHENIAFPLRLRKMPDDVIRRRVAEILGVVQLEGYGGRYPRQLSGGQQQRVALARSLVFHPPLLLMDEPLGALDKNLRESMQIELRHLSQRFGITVLFVTHDQEEAMTMSDRIAVIHQGRLQQIGPPDALYESPVNEFVANFIGESNLLSGRVVAVDGGTARLRSDGGAEFTTAANGAPAGQAVRFMIRPERFRVAADAEGSAAGSDGLPGVVQETIYVGEFRKYTVRINGTETLSVRQPNQSGAAAWRPKDRVRLSVDPGDVRIV